MKNVAIFIYSILCYLMFLGVSVYAVCFIGNIKITNSIDALPSVPYWHAFMINLGLLCMFALQHSGMARKSFKAWITKFIPKAAERSTYILFSNIAMIVIFYFWEPMGGVIWSTDSEFLKTSLLTLYMFGWAIVLISSYLINHFHLFGLQQAWGNLVGKTYNDSHFVTPTIYKHVRHPLYVGWVVLVWATPIMTSAHLIFALGCTAYILMGIQFEEKDLIDEFGDEYKEYQKNVPMLIPSIKQAEIKEPQSSL